MGHPLRVFPPSSSLWIYQPSGVITHVHRIDHLKPLKIQKFTIRPTLTKFRYALVKVLAPQLRLPISTHSVLVLIIPHLSPFIRRQGNNPSTRHQCISKCRLLRRGVVPSPHILRTPLLPSLILRLPLRFTLSLIRLILFSPLDIPLGFTCIISHGRRILVIRQLLILVSRQPRSRHILIIRIPSPVCPILHLIVSQLTVQIPINTIPLRPGSLIPTTCLTRKRLPLILPYRRSGDKNTVRITSLNSSKLILTPLRGKRLQFIHTTSTLLLGFFGHAALYHTRHSFPA